MCILHNFNAQVHKAISGRNYRPEYLH